LNNFAACGIISQQHDRSGKSSDHGHVFYAIGAKNAADFMSLHKPCPGWPQSLTKTRPDDILQASRLRKAVADLAGT
jgi:hypothetical protein